MGSTFPHPLMMMSHSFIGVAPMLGLAMLGHLALLSGLVLLLAWAIKHLHGDKLKQAALWCIAVGIVLWLLSAAFGMGSYRRGYDDQKVWKMRVSGEQMMDAFGDGIPGDEQ